VQADRREKLYEDVLEQVTLGKASFESAALAGALNLALTYDVQQSFLWKPLNALGLVRSSFNLMAILRFAYQDGLQLSEIGELLITSRANITGLVDHLESKGLVKRTVASHDRRVRVAKLTKKGETLIDDIMPAHSARTVALFSHFTVDEMQQLTSLLKKIRQSPAIVETGLDYAAALDPVYINED
jgi:MarR family 2-MHQ and catechol resistance regulon transcriptional repressor